MKPVPVMTTVVPPATGPAFGLRPVTVGPYVYFVALLVADVPDGDVTETSIGPLPAGALTVREVSELMVNVVPLVPPKVTEVALRKPVPVTVTGVLPAAGPKLGLSPVTVGTPSYVNWSALPVAEVPTAVVTVTSTGPATPPGEVAVMGFAGFAVIEAAVPPNFTP